MNKEQAAESYEMKFKNRGRIGHNHHNYRKGGNAYSTKKSCLTSYRSGRARANYLVEKRNLDIPDYKPTHVDPRESAKVMRSGGTLPAGPNQFHESPTVSERPKRPTRERTPRCCHLNEIHPNL